MAFYSASAIANGVQKGFFHGFPRGVATVYVNGTATTAFTDALGYVTFTTAPAAGALVLMVPTDADQTTVSSGGATSFNALTGRLLPAQVPSGGSAGQALGPDGAWFTPPSANVYQTPFNLLKPTYSGAVVAKGDGATYDNAAIKAAVRAANAAGGGLIYCPAGVYLIDLSDPNVFGDIAVQNSSKQAGSVQIVFWGEGDANTIFRFSGGANPASEVFMLANPTGFNSLIGCNFIGIGYQGSAPDSDGGWAYSTIRSNVSFLKLTGTDSPAVQPQAFRFHLCGTYGFSTNFTFDGNAVCSEVYHSMGNYKFARRHYNLKNAQSLNHVHHACSVELIMGPIVQFNANSLNPGLCGGAVHFFGGSIICGNGSSGPGTDFWAFDMPVALIGDCSVTGCRFEMRGANAKFARIADQGYMALNFSDTTILETATATKTDWMTCGHGGRITWTTVHLKSDYKLEIKVNANSVQGWGGSILFDKCTVPQDFASWCSMAGFAGGAIIGTNMRGVNNSGGLVTWANDFCVRAPLLWA